MAVELYTHPLFSDANLQSYWRMEGNSNDAKGANNGTDTSISYNASYGKFGQGADFNGTSSKIVIGNVFNYTSAITVGIWIKPDNITDDLPIFGKPYTSLAAPYVQWGLKTYANNAYFQAAQGGNMKTAQGATTLVVGNPYLLIGTYDGSNMRIIVNGVQDGIIAVTGNLNTYATNVEIGHYAPANTFMDAKIDEPFVLDRAMSVAEALAYYNFVKSGGFMMYY